MISGNQVSSLIAGQTQMLQNNAAYHSQFAHRYGPMGMQMGAPPTIMPSAGMTYAGGDPFNRSDANNFALSMGSGVAGAIPGLYTGAGLVAAGAGLMGYSPVGSVMLDPFQGIFRGAAARGRMAAGVGLTNPIGAYGSFRASAGAAMQAGRFGAFARGAMIGGGLAALPYMAGTMDLTFYSVSTMYQPPVQIRSGYGARYRAWYTRRISYAIPG